MKTGFANLSIKTRLIALARVTGIVGMQQEATQSLDNVVNGRVLSISQARRLGDLFDLSKRTIQHSVAMKRQHRN